MKSAFPRPRPSDSSSFGATARVQGALRNRVVPALDAKRCFDIVGAALGLAALSPLFVLVMIIMSVRDPGPAFFAHERIGRGGRKFRCLKFRTMVRNADEVLEHHLLHFPEAALEWRATQKLKQDPRVTPVGRMLRKTSLDELPQLLNVLRGEMSLVGPRPVIEDELRRYGSAQADYLSVRPGITGLWQISGRNDTSYEARVALDRHYVRTRSFVRDCIILSRTVVVVFFQKGSY